MAKIPQVTRPSPIIQSLQVCLDADRRSDDILSYYIFFLSIELYLFLKRLFDFDLYAEKLHCSIFIREVLKLP